MSNESKKTWTEQSIADLHYHVHDMLVHFAHLASSEDARERDILLREMLASLGWLHRTLGDLDVSEQVAHERAKGYWHVPEHERQ